MSDSETERQLYCLICNVEVSVNTSYSIFYTVIPHSGTLLANSIQNVIHREVEHTSIPSTFICTKCFGLFEELDYSEKKCVTIKRDILTSFAKSCLENGYELQEVRGVACQTENDSVTRNGESVNESLKVEKWEYAVNAAEGKQNSETADSEDEEEEEEEEEEDDEDEAGKYSAEDNKEDPCKLDASGKSIKRKESSRKKTKSGKVTPVVSKDIGDNKIHEIKTKDLRRRRRYVHPCRICGRLFRRPCEVKQHLLSHGGAKPYQCKDCGRRFGSKSGAGIHALKQHGKDGSVENVIDVCNIDINTVSALYSSDTDKDNTNNNNSKEEKTEVDISCISQSEKGSSDDDFEWKMDEDLFNVKSEDPVSDNEDIIPPDKVKEEIPAEEVKEESESDTKDCKEETTHDTAAAKVTMETKQRAKPGRKKVEGGSSSGVEIKRERKRRKGADGASQEKKTKKKGSYPKPLKHECKVCGKMWRTMSEFKSHVATHSDERPFICEICGQAYKHKAALDIHVGMHNGINPFSCPFCNKAFTQKGALQRHLPIHTGEAPFQCELCGKRFVHHTSFNMHTLAHTGQKSYKCKVCGLALLSGSHLKRHSRVHTGERPYQCQTCGKRFAERYNLVAHNRIHDPLSGSAREGTFKKVHRCQLCGACFERKPKLEDHLALNHNKISDSDDSRKWVGHLISNELNTTPTGSNASIGSTVSQISLHQSNPPLPMDISRRRPNEGANLLLQSHLHGGTEVDSKSVLVNTASTHHALTNQHQQSWHHMIFGGGAKMMEGELVDNSGLEGNVPKMVPISAVLENPHRLLTDMTTLSTGLAAPGQGAGRNLLPSCLTGGHTSLPPPPGNQHHIPNVPNPHAVLGPHRINMFPTDNNQSPNKSSYT